ncbi:Transcriptional activator protein CzcR [Pirellulimonas nuda]|uniref:Transcriptional activator protein CzcR n=1 Tax=Pirellulimonas nuda TaxID=2528009 RepID=A0A518DFX5_9BACT|nr:response regulator [Pirellulimonas nuda]QDU90385.1 Transcriptional activator protein CzcR [Pirellulimonas nuda]
MTSEATPQPRVLIAEDDPALADVLRLAFTRAGFAAQVAGNGLEALRIAGDSCFDVICSDYQMPMLDGEQFLTAVRSGGCSQDAVCLLCSAKTYELDCQRLRDALNLHAVFYKPFSLAEIAASAVEGLATRAAV